MVPVLLAAQIIDLARNQTRVIEAGASLVPMPNQTVDVAKWTGDPSAAWHSENAATAPSDATMTKVTLKARALTALTVVSRELIEDAPNVGDELARAFAASFAVQVDKAALYGSGTDPEPRGVKNTTGVMRARLGVDGAALTDYDPFVDAVGTLAAVASRRRWRDHRRAAHGAVGGQAEGHHEISRSTRRVCWRGCRSCRVIRCRSI